MAGKFYGWREVPKVQDGGFVFYQSFVDMDISLVQHESGTAKIINSEFIGLFHFVD